MQVNAGQDESREHSTAAASLAVDSSSRVPLATQIARQIMWQVVTGRIAPGSPLPVTSDLAGHLGVNVHTVRAAYRQLADDGIVSMSRGTRTRVLGYDMRRARSGSDSHPSFTIGVMVSEFTNFYANYLEALTRAAEIEGWLPIICRTRHYAPDVVNRYMDQLISRNVDGIILVHFETGRDAEVVRTLRSGARLRPFVLVDSADIGAGSHIAVDRDGDAFDATTHLVEHGHTRIGLVSSPPDWSSHLLLRSGYDRALAAAGRPTDGRLVVHVSDLSFQAGAKAAMPLLQADDPPTAILCVGDAVAFGAISAARELGLRVPEDLAVVGYGELPIARLATIPLSTVQVPADQVGYEAIRTLRSAIDEGDPQPPVTIRTTLMTRESCGCASH